MNPVEIEQAISDLAEAPFDATEFPYAFLEAFGRKETEIKKLRKGDSNKSDLGGVLQRNNIHIATCAPGEVSQTLAALKASPATAKHKAKFILATDGQTFEAEDLIGGDTVACAYPDFPDSFGVFLPLAGISTVKQIKESAFDIKATGRLNRLYMELLKDNPDWGKIDRRPDMNHFMARLIFCFFAEDTDIFASSRLFTGTIEQMSNRDGTNTHEIISEIFRAMNVPLADRADANLPRWADAFPYVNGGLFSGSTEVPRFSKIAQRYLSHIGGLDWTKINPDIFGSMIQAVADESERSALGMHYTSVPNILKVLNPLFLDDLNAALEEAGDNARKLLNLRNRIAKIRVFDPACGSGNFLVIAYKQLRAIEAEINRRRGEADRKTDIPLTNFRGIELRDFSAEIARLALIIAEYQCDVTYRGQKEALAEFLPLDSQNWITCGNALRLDWLSICPPTGTGVKFQAEDLFQTPLDQAQIDFENAGGETYICGNPPYVGDKNQTIDQKSDLKHIAGGRKDYKAADYVTGWIWKASDFIKVEGSFAFVTTNSICQGVQVPIVWGDLESKGQEIYFAHRSFYWKNNASNNANVICVIVGVRNKSSQKKYIYDAGIKREVSNINAYLVDGPSLIVLKHPSPIAALPQMVAGNIPRDQANFMLSHEERNHIIASHPGAEAIIRRIQGSREFINGIERYCLWIPDHLSQFAWEIPEVAERLKRIVEYRRYGSERGKLGLDTPHRFERTIVAKERTIIVPRVSSERREYLPVGVLEKDIIVSDAAQAIYDAPLYVISIVGSKLHRAWVDVTAGRMKSDFRYSSGVCYNSFPIPKLTEKNRKDLTRCAEDILLAREAHFPATIADLYDPEKMPANLRAAHDRNDETLERIYIGRRFKNDTERLEKLFDMYTKMTMKVPA
ncbi:lactate dehydrogenase [Xinfangfangia sp. CPCC 101601]|uniref:site-specific DNA-methyltransferase (adenine-specific) n=1 Tax=Pseudogemmobacter lacusdianii TaxID=3069608 RepID=A0ABU0VZF2_9RHOB|nr:DNA methyltransferase [Xinfangfangia sp. CPCC 101601]MDQ2067129.1 lactate dehydrogenase [Xinfangfangia sp. CPCC 101601]